MASSTSALAIGGLRDACACAEFEIVISHSIANCWSSSYRSSHHILCFLQGAATNPLRNGTFPLPDGGKGISIHFGASEGIKKIRGGSRSVCKVLAMLDDDVFLKLEKLTASVTAAALIPNRVVL